MYGYHTDTLYELRPTSCTDVLRRCVRIAPTYAHYVKQDYNIEKTHMAVDQASKEIHSINSTTTQAKTGFLESITEKFDTAYYKQKLSQYESIASNAGENILNLMVAFIFKTIVFPILFLFLLYKLLKNLFGLER